jgi:hypothetical protein
MGLVSVLERDYAIALMALPRDPFQPYEAQKAQEMSAVPSVANKSLRWLLRPGSERKNAAVGFPQRQRHARHRYGRLEIAPCRHFGVARAEERCGGAVCRMPCVTGDPIGFLHCHLLSRSSGRWNRSTASWSAPALTLLSTALGGRLGRLPARTTETLLIYPRFPRFAQLMPAAAPARNGAAEPPLWKGHYF